MRWLLPVCVLSALMSVAAAPQEPAVSPTPSQPELPKPETIKLYDREAGLTPASVIPPESLSPIQSECKGKKEKGSVSFTFIVDAKGQARNITFSQFTNNAIDFLAVQVIENDRFLPAVLNRDFVATSAAMKMDMEVCAETVKGSDGTPMQKLTFRSTPLQKMEKPSRLLDEAVLAPIAAGAAVAFKVGGSTTAPQLSHYVGPTYSDSARANRIQGVCLFQLTVDEYGLPRNIKELKAVDPSLQENAYLALWQYRFKPAMRSGLPVPVQITVEVNFKLY